MPEGRIPLCWLTNTSIQIQIHLKQHHKLEATLFTARWIYAIQSSLAYYHHMELYLYS